MFLNLDIFKTLKLDLTRKTKNVAIPEQKQNGLNGNTKKGRKCKFFSLGLKKSFSGSGNLKRPKSSPKKAKLVSLQYIIYFYMCIITKKV